jgi:hypothetical protein
MEALMSLSRNTRPGDGQVQRLEQRIQEEEARLRRMVLQGVPTQASDDLVRRLRASLQQMKERPRRLF